MRICRWGEFSGGVWCVGVGVRVEVCVGFKVGNLGPGANRI